MARVSIRFTGEPTDANRASESVERGLEGVSKQAVQTRASLAGVWGDPNQAKQFAAALDGIDVRFRGLGKSTRDVNQGFALLHNVMGLLKWPALISAAGFAAQALSALAGGAVALAGALGPLTGLLAAIPAGLGALVASAVTVKLAFSDMKEALAGNAEAIKRLTPEARAFASTLKGLTPIITELRKAAQQTLFPGLEQALKTVLTRENLAAVKAGLTGVGQALGDAAVQIAKVLGTKQFAADLNLLFKQFESIIRAAGVAAGFFTSALVNIMVAAKPLIGFLNQSIVAFAKWTAETTTAGRATGDLQRFFEGTVTTMKQLGAILGPLGSALLNIFKAAKPLTDAILADLGAVTAKFKEWTASASGQNRIAQYFADVKEPLYEMGRLLRDVVKAFFELGTQPGVVNLIRQLRTELLPAIVTLISTTTQSLGPALVNLFTNAAKLMTQLAGATGPLIALVKILDGVVKGLNAFLSLNPQLKSMTINALGMVAVFKTLSFAAAITGAKALAVSLGLIAPAAVTGGGAMSAAMLAGGGAATVATGAVARLRAALMGLSLLKIVVPIFLAYEAYGPMKDFFTDKLGANFEGISGNATNPTMSAKGVWVGADGKPVQDQAYWNKKYQAGQVTKTGSSAVGGVSAGQNLPGSSGDRPSGPMGVSATAGASGPMAQLRTAADIVQIGRILQGMGLSVGEHPAFGGVDPVHTESSYHYTGQAIDVSGDAALLDAAAAELGKNPNVIELIWRAKGHYNHMHVAAGKVGAQGTYTKVGGGSSGLASGAALTSGAAAAPAPPSQAQVTLQKAIGGLKERAAALTDDIPEIARSITPKLEALYDSLGDKRLSEKALANIRATGAELRHALSNLIKGDELRDRIPNLRGTINSILDDETRESLQKRANALEALMKTFMKDKLLSDAEVATFAKRMKALNAAVNQAFTNDTLERITGLRGKLNELFAKGFIDEASLEKARAALDRIPAMLKKFIANDGILGPEEKKKIRQQLSIAQEIVDAGNEAMRAAEKAFGKLKQTFRDLIADGVLSDADLAILSKSVAGIGGKIGIGLQEAVAAVEKGRQDFDTAWASLRSAIETAFREQVIGKFQLTIDFASAYEQMATSAARLKEALAALSKALEGQLSSDEQAVATALERVRRAGEEYTAAIISQDQERIKAAIDERLAANAALKALEAQGLSERAQAILTAGREVIAAEQEIGSQQIAEQKRIWEETKTAALAGVLAVVDGVALRLRDGKITWAQAVGEIGVALTAAGMDAGSAADLLGQNVASAMATAANAVALAVTALTTAINNLVRIMGGAVSSARGHVSEAEALYLRLQKIAGASEAEAMRIANAAASAGVAQSPGAAAPAPAKSTAPPPSPGSQAASPSPSTSPSSPPPEDPQRSGGGGGGRTVAMAEGGIIERPFAGFATLAERFPEAIVPMPPDMNPDLRRWLTELAQGGWRRQSLKRPARPDADLEEFPLLRRAGGWGGWPIPGLPRAPAAPPRFTVPRGGLLALGTGGLGRTPGFLATGADGSEGGVSPGGGGGNGGTVVNLNVPVTVHHDGIITADRDLGETIARVATRPIRDELVRLGVNNVDIFGGRA